MAVISWPRPDTRLRCTGALPSARAASDARALSLDDH